MPYVSTYTEPDIFLTHNDVNIYHIYKDDDLDEGIRTYWYGYDEDCDDSGTSSFDIRELSNYDKDEDPDHKDILIEAIELGLLTSEGVVYPNESESNT